MATKPAQANEIELSVEQKVKALFELQTVDSQIDSINRIKGELPLEVADLEDVVAGLELRIQTLTTEIETTNAASKARKEDIENAKTNIAKYAEQQKEVRNNREYESINKEVEFQQLEIELAEKHIKEFAVEIKAKKKLIEENKQTLEGRKLDLAEKKSELKNIEAETAKEIETLTEQEQAIASKIDERLLSAYNKIRQNVRNGLGVVTVKREACGGCFNSIPPQRQLDIRLNKKIIVCEYCGRIIVSDQLFPENEEL